MWTPLRRGPTTVFGCDPGVSEHAGEAIPTEAAASATPDRRRRRGRLTRSGAPRSAGRIRKWRRPRVRPPQKPVPRTSFRFPDAPWYQTETVEDAQKQRADTLMSKVPSGNSPDRRGDNPHVRRDSAPSLRCLRRLPPRVPPPSVGSRFGNSPGGLALCEATVRRRRERHGDPTRRKRQEDVFERNARSPPLPKGTTVRLRRSSRSSSPRAGLSEQRPQHRLFGKRNQHLDQAARVERTRYVDDEGRPREVPPRSATPAPLQNGEAAEEPSDPTKATATPRVARARRQEVRIGREFVAGHRGPDEAIAHVVVFAGLRHVVFDDMAPPPLGTGAH